jgi:DNA (cytosine-5)-methyltransferase 1
MITRSREAAKQRDGYTAVDLFCGAGGTSTGLLQAARELQQPVCLTAINHWTTAINTHSLNHPDVRHICGRIENIRPTEVVPGRRLNLLVASPECTHHSTAAGGQPKNDQSRSQAWMINHWLSELQVDALMVENVREFQNWGPLGKNRKPLKRYKGKFFKSWIESLRNMGYQVEWRVLNAADYGDPQDRHRLIVMASRQPIVWPKPTHGPEGHQPRRAAREIIDWSLKGKSIFRRQRPLSANTMRRIAAGLRKFGGVSAEPFLLMISQTGSNSDCVRSLDRPLATVCTKQEAALVEPFIVVANHGPTSKTEDHRAKSVNRPLPTVTTSNSFALVSPMIIGQQSCAAARPVTEPMPTVATAGAVALVEPFLVKYYGTATAASIDQPLDTVTTKDRFMLVEPTTQRPVAEIDILFRMLQPHELAGAFTFPRGYQFTGTKTEQVKQIGNAVPVKLAEACTKQILLRAFAPSRESTTTEVKP